MTKPWKKINRREEMLRLREKIIKENPEIKTAEELAKHMGDLAGEYWAWQLENFLANDKDNDD